MLLDNTILVSLVVLLPFISVGIIPLLRRAGDKAIAWLSVIIALLIAVFVFLLVPEIWREGAVALTPQYDWIPSLGIIFSVHIDPLALFLAGIASGIGLLVVLYSTKYMEGEKGLPRYYSLVLLFIGAMICLVLTDNLLILYFFWEIVGLCSYALISFNHEDSKAAKAGIKAFVTTRVGDVGLLIGIFILYAGAITVPGTTTAQAFSIQYLISNASAIPLNYVAFASFLFILGAMGKSAQVPLHAWLPDAMEAPTTISALIHAATMVNAGIYVLARMSPLFIDVYGWATMLLIVGAVTAFLAALMAVVEPDLKRLLAYSTISQLGFMVFALGLGAQGVFVAQYHLLNHSIFKALLFLCAGAIIHSVGTRNMYEMRGLRKEMKYTHIFMLFGALALAGIPIFSGFWSKDLIFSESLSAGLYVPLAIMAITAILTAAYSFRMYFLVFHGESKRKKPVHEAPGVMLAVLAILAVGALLSWASIEYFSMGFSTFHLGLEETHRIGAFVSETFTNKAILISFCALALGFVLYYFRNSLKKNIVSQWIIINGRRGFGFNDLYDSVLLSIKEIGIRLRRMQSGDANLNFVGFLAILLILLLVMLLQGAI